MLKEHVGGESLYILLSEKGSMHNKISLLFKKHTALERKQEFWIQSQFRIGGSE